MAQKRNPAKSESPSIIDKSNTLKELVVVGDSSSIYGGARKQYESQIYDFSRQQVVGKVDHYLR